MKFLLVMWAMSASNGYAVMPILAFDTPAACERFAEAQLDTQPVSPSVDAPYEYLCHPVKPSGGGGGGAT